MKRSTDNSKKSKPGNQLRIIGGQWRGRKLTFADVEGLRPSGDRIRETLFNWLTPYLEGANCLDLFAGSGSLGLEALSRNAAHTTLIDKSTAVTRQLQQHIKTLNCSRAEIIHADSMIWLNDTGGQTPEKGFDIVFLDPPFADKQLNRCFELLQRPGLLNPSAVIYFEADLNTSLPDLADNWILHRHKKTGQVQYGLVCTHP